MPSASLRITATRSLVSPSLASGSSDPGRITSYNVCYTKLLRIYATLLSKAHAATLPASPDWSRYARTPFPHQQEGIEWMLKLLNVALHEDPEDLYRLQGGLLADDMGLGKKFVRPE